MVQTNQFLAYGALVGGPQSDDTFEDSRGWCCAAYNEVAIDYNAGFTGAVARLVDYYKDQKLFSDCTLDLGWDHVNATIVSHSLQSPALLALTSKLFEGAQPFCQSYLACPSGVYSCSQAGGICTTLGSSSSWKPGVSHRFQAGWQRLIRI